MEAQPMDAETAGNEQRAKAQEFKSSGNDKFNKSNYKGAIVDYQKGLLHEPNNPDLHANLSAAYLYLEKYIEAEEHALFAIHLRPNFYKGYMRAAKADHGKGMTKLALKRLAQGLSNVTDPNGVKELNRLKKQYTDYLSLQSNNEREMDFDSDTYQSEEDEDEGLSTDDDSGDDQPPQFNGLPPPAEAEPLAQPAPSDPPAAQPPAPLPYELCGLDMSKQEAEESVEPVKIESIAIEKEQLNNSTDPTKTEEKKTDKIEPPLKSVEPKVSAEQQSEHKKEKSYNEKQNEQHALDRLRELARSSEMKKSIADFKDNLKTGGEAYLLGNYRKAADNYKAAYERVGKRYLDFETDERQCNVIRYASYVAMINLNTYDDIIKGIHGLNDMTKFGFDFPAIYIQIARGYYKLNRFKTALEPLEKLQGIIDNCPIFPTFTWPGTNETMEETTPIGLKNSIKELNQLCRMSHKPSATCRFDNCLKTSSHILPSELIYTNDPDFIGFVRMICEEKCHIEFHIPCWKSYKESVCGIGKINDKDFLGRRCLTTDCVNSEGEPSIITTIEIIGSDGQVKSVNKLDPKANSEQKAAEKKAKKKRSKLDDKENKEKVTKPKKIKEKKVKTKEKKQNQTSQEDANADEEDYEFPRVNTSVDPVKAMQIRKESLEHLRKLKFGLNEKNYWDPKYAFYGRPEESVKASNNQYLDQSNDSTEVKDAKEFLFSYFLSILKDEGPLKLSEVEDLWKESAGDFCDMTVVLPKLTSMCDLLMESTRFCQVEDRLCLADQLEEAYETVRDEVVDTVTFLMTGATSCDAASCETDSTKDHEDAALSSGEDTEYESSSDGDESEDEGSDDEDKDEMEEDNNFISPQNSSVPPPREIEPLKPKDDGKFSLEEMLKEMTRMKNILEKGSEEGDISPTISESDPSKDQPEESISNETFETAHGSSANTTSEDIKISIATDSPNSETSNSDRRETVLSDHIDSEDTVVPSSADLSGDAIDATGHHDDRSQPLQAADETQSKHPVEHSEAVKLLDAIEGFVSSERDKGSQSAIQTEERHIQTAPLETKDRLSQTKESDLYKELNKKVQELSSQLSVVNKENARLSKELGSKEQIQKAQHNAITRLQDENRRNLEAHKSYQELMKAELLRKDKEYKRKEDELTKSMNNMKEMYTSLLQDNNQVKKEMCSLLKDTEEVKQSLTAALTNIKDFEASYKTLELNMKSRLQKALQAQLNLIKACWETQLNLHKKRCVEKITEMQSWFSISPGEVESLPSYPLIQQNILQWMEMAKHLQQIEFNFQEKYLAMEKKIEQGNDIEDLKPEILPAMPKEPLLPPLEKIHKEITEKHLKTISDLTQLVASQQLQIEKSKEQMLMNAFGGNQMGQPRLPQPLTTAFGSLALQYPYPGTVPPQFPMHAVPTVLPGSQDAAAIGNAPKLPDVQALLQESSKMFSSMSSASSLMSPVLKDEARSQSPPLGNPYSYPPPLMPPPPSLPLPTRMGPQPSAAVPGPALPTPPPLIGVAQNLLKNSAVVTEQKKDTKPPEQRAVTPKLEQKVVSSRESTPVRATAPVAPTPEKTKKKKKNKSGEATAAEARLAAAVSLDSASGTGDEAARDDESGWNVVLPKSAMPKQLAQASGPLPESKLKNKRKLLDKLQTRFPTTLIKDLDDIVKQVREHNNGSLSGLLFDDIEARVERILTKRHLQKNSTMGLEKFSAAAWGTVKPQEIITWSNLQLEECTICLEPMGHERTKVDCNHEFHTKCLRKWLKEKSVCPLCNKFTTMPDEFPAL